MSIFKRLAEKPWLDDGANVVEMRAASYAASNQKVALVCFLAIVAVLFSLFFTAYHMRLEPLEFGAGFASDWVPMPESPLLWFNTAVLVLASAAYELARRRGARGDLANARIAFLFAGAATLAFLALQLAVWNQMLGRGYYAHSNPANSFFYLITAVHGVHLAGGLIAWARAALRFSRQADAEHLRGSVDLCALYWHFLLLVWLGMLALFANT